MKIREEQLNILSLITALWLSKPELRLTQLVGNCFEAGEDLYHIEDVVLFKKLRKVYLKENDDED